MSEIKNALFIGMYPNALDKYKNVFFQNLVFAIADKGIKCTVISPVSITKYRMSIGDIPKKNIQKTLKGNEVTVYYPRYTSLSSKQIGKINTETFSESLFENSVVQTVKKLKNDFDFVYGHFVLYGGLAAIKVGNLLQIPSFFAYGECDFYSEVGNTYGIPKEKEITGLTGIISVSKKNTMELKNLGFTKDVPIITVPNSTNLSLFHKMDKNDCREKLGLPKDKFIVGFVGGFIERKGDKRLLAAVNQIEDAYVAFAGRGDDKPSGDRVVFCGAMEHEEIPVLLNAIDVFILPTLAEGSCNAIIEAMSCGVPVISSNLSFNDDILDDNNSIRIDPMSINEIRDAIISLKDYDTRKIMGEKAWQTARGLSIEARAEKILSFINAHSIGE